jgi:hypothetical protein
VARRDEKWIGGIVGLVTGVVSAATGVQVIPSMPYMQAIGKEKGFGLILARGAGGMLYNREALDITEMVIQRFNKKG